MLLEIFIGLWIIAIIIIAAVWIIYGGYRAGRVSGGVYCVYAPPGEGKTYIATALILEYLKQGRQVFSNFPVITPDLKYQTKFWQKSLMKEQIQKSVIVIDESYKDYNSREYKTFSKDDHDWFATSGHNENSIYLLTQNPQRIDTVIREIVNFYIFVEKVEIPLLGIPLFFRLFYFRSEEDMRVSKYGMVEPWDVQKFWFNWYCASSYDTKFFRRPYDKPYIGTDWIKKLEEKKFYYHPPNASGIAYLKLYLNNRWDDIITMASRRYNSFMSQIGQKNDESLEHEEQKEEIKEERKEPLDETQIYDDTGDEKHD